MDQAVEGSTADKKSVRGRRDSSGGEAVIKTKPLKDNLKDACTLARKHKEAGEKLRDKIKAVAEQSGLQSSVVRKAVMAKMGDRFEEVKRDAEQLGLALDAVQSESAV